MHELSIAQGIVDLACARAGGRPVRSVRIRAGRLTAVVPDAMRFCFDLAAEDSVARGARLEIVETPGLARCRACRADVMLEQPYGRCACGASDLQWLSGDSLRILEMEVA
jgi:hydrogenase nickel incorporation protein HypA/HybF